MGMSPRARRQECGGNTHDRDSVRSPPSTAAPSTNPQRSNMFASLPDSGLVSGFTDNTAQVALKRRQVGGSGRRRRYGPQTTWSVVGGNAYIMRNVIHQVVYRWSPHYAPHSVPVLATSSTAEFNIVPVLARSPGTRSLKFPEAP